MKNMLKQIKQIQKMQADAQRVAQLQETVRVQLAMMGNRNRKLPVVV